MNRLNIQNLIFIQHGPPFSKTIGTFLNLLYLGSENITLPKRQALNDLAKDLNIVIKPADKGGAVVVWDRDKYIQEGIRQLSDNHFYVEIDTDLTSKHHREVVTILDDMHSHQEIYISCYKYLTYTPIRTAKVYMLPKIHKDKANPPGRPIVSGNGCPKERIFQFVDFFLQPGVKDKGHILKTLLTS